MRITNKILFSVLLMLILVIPAIALQEDFTAFSNNKELNLCACSLRQDNLVIRNTGSVTSTFMLEQDGEAAKWTNLAPQSFYLEPNERTEVQQFINVPCYAEGEYTLKTKIKTLFDLEKVLEQKVKVKKCVNIQIIQHTETQTACPCTPLEYEFEISNIGQHTETYTLEVEPFADNVQLSENFLVLEPGESRKVIAFINLPCDVYGLQTLNIKAFAQGTKLLGESDFDVDIEKCYDYDLVVEKGDVCQNVDNRLSVTIDNKADIANKYVLTSNALFANFEDNPLFAWGGLNATTNLILTPSDELTGQTLNISVSSISERGEEQKTAVFDSTVENCFDSELIQQDVGFFGVECESNSFGFLLQNTGTRDTVFNISLEGPEFATLDSEAFALGPEESGEFFMDIDAPCNESKGTYDFKIKSQSEDYPYAQEFKSKLKIVSAEKAYKIDMFVDKAKADYSEMHIPVYIRHEGLVGTRYDLSVVGWKNETAGMFSLDTKSIVLDAGEGKEVYLTFNPSENLPEGVYKFSVFADTADLRFEKTVTISLTTTSSYEKVKEFISTYWLYLLLGLIVLIIIILIAVFAARSRKDEFDDEFYEESEFKDTEDVDFEGKKSRTGLLAAIIIIIIIAAIIGSYFLAGHLMAQQDNQTIDQAELPQDVSLVEDGLTDIAEETGEIDQALADVVTQETAAQPLIEIDRSQISGKGNKIYSDGSEIKLPITVYNPTDKKAIYKIEVDELGSWLRPTHTRLIIPEQESKETAITIKPDLETLQEQDYNVNVDIDLKGEKLQYTEELDFVIKKQKSLWEQYWFWIIVGVIALLIIIPIINAVRKPKEEEEFQDLEESENPHKAKKEKKEKASKEAYYDSVEQPETRGIKTFLIVLAVVVILLIAAGLSAYLIYNNTGSNAAEESDVSGTSAIETSQSDQTADISEPLTDTSDEVEKALMQIDRSNVPGKGNQVLFKGEEALDVLLVVNNPFAEEAKFVVNEESDWLEFESNKLSIPALGSADLLMTITPDYEVLELNNYNLEIIGSLSTSTESTSEKISLQASLKKSFFTSYLFYVIAAVVVLFLVILFVELLRKEKDNEFDEEFVDLNESENPHKAKKQKKEKNVKKVKPKKTSKIKKTKPKKSKSKSTRTNIKLR